LLKAPGIISKNMALFGKTFKVTIVSLIIAELLSLLSYLTPALEQATFFIVVIIALFFTLKKIEYGFYILLAELFIGSKGYLFFLDLNSTRLSIRIALFLIVGTIWCWQRLKRNDLIILKNKLSRSYLLLLIFILISFLIGIKNNEFSNVFFDVNAWLFFLLAFVFFDLIKSTKQIENILQILLAATTLLSLKTIGTLFSFSHGLDLIGGPFYKWIRDTGVGEITYVGGNIFRVFFQSHLYVLIGFLIILGFLMIKHESIKTKKQYLYLGVYLYLTSLAIIVSQSRSFWLGGLGGLIVLIALSWFRFNFRLKKTIILIVILVAIFASQILIIQVITGNFSGNLITNRFKDLEAESAGISRLNQLKPLTYNILQQMITGYGFGKTLTYKSNDPRILQNHPDGIYTTYAFEWGYLDIWLKMGLMGLLVYIFLIYKIAKLAFGKMDKQKTLSIGLLAGLTALLITNIFSPYLNHPLGIGYLMLMSAIIINN